MSSLEESQTSPTTERPIYTAPTRNLNDPNKIGSQSSDEDPDVARPSPYCCFARNFCCCLIDS